MWGLQAVNSSLGSRQQLAQADSELLDSLGVRYRTGRRLQSRMVLGKEEFLHALTVAVGW